MAHFSQFSHHIGSIAAAATAAGPLSSTVPHLALSNGIWRGLHQNNQGAAGSNPFGLPFQLRNAHFNRAVGAPTTTNNDSNTLFASPLFGKSSNNTSTTTLPYSAFPLTMGIGAKLNQLLHREMHSATLTPSLFPSPVQPLLHDSPAEIEHDSDDTRLDDLRLLKDVSSDNSPSHTPRGVINNNASKFPKEAYNIAASLGVGMNNLFRNPTPPLAFSSAKKRSISPNESAVPFSSPSRRVPSLTEALSMNPVDLVYGLTSTDKQLEQGEIIRQQQLQENKNLARQLREQETESEIVQAESSLLNSSKSSNTINRNSANVSFQSGSEDDFNAVTNDQIDADDEYYEIDVNNSSATPAVKPPLMNRLLEFLTSDQQQQNNKHALVTAVASEMSTPLTSGVATQKYEKTSLLSRPHELEEFFSSYGEKDVNGFNLLIRVCAAKGLYDLGWQHLEHMKQIGLAPDESTYTALMSLCAAGVPHITPPTVTAPIHSSVPIVNGFTPVVNNIDLKERKIRMARAWNLLEEYKATHNGKACEPFFNCLARTAGRLVGLEESLVVLDKMKQNGITPTVVIYTELINICRKIRTKASLAKAEQIFKMLQSKGGALEPDTHTYNVMIRTAADAKTPEVAIFLFEQMRDKHYMPDEFTYGNLMQACLHSRNLAHYSNTFEYFSEFISAGGVASRPMYNMLLNACAKQADVANALRVWELMNQLNIKQDACSYSTMFNAFANSMKQDNVPMRVAKENEDLATIPMLSKNARYERADALLSQMEKMQVPICILTVNSYLRIYARGLKLNQIHSVSKELFEKRFPHIKPNFSTYKMIVLMYADSHRYSKMIEHLELLRKQPDSASSTFESSAATSSSSPASSSSSIVPASNAIVASVLNGGGYKATYSLYHYCLNSLRHPPKSGKYTVQQLEEMGTAIINMQKADGAGVVSAEDERFFSGELSRAWAKNERERKLREDTIKFSVPKDSLGLPASFYENNNSIDANQQLSRQGGNNYSDQLNQSQPAIQLNVDPNYLTLTQREDAMLRPEGNRTGRGRLGHQTQRFLEQPKLAKYKQNREKRKEVQKDKFQGVNFQKKREQQQLLGHHY